MVGTPYSQTLTASGGNPPFEFQVTAGALPPGISLSSGGLLSGTPTASGTFNFTITAIENGGFGPKSGSQPYTLTVADVPPIANPVSATVAYGSGANPITLNITGGVPDSVAVASAPANGTAIASGTSITYQPNTGFAGTDSFTYTATNSGGTSAPATVSITVTAPTVTLSPVHCPMPWAARPIADHHRQRRHCAIQFLADRRRASGWHEFQQCRGTVGHANCGRTFQLHRHRHRQQYRSGTVYG